MLRIIESRPWKLGLLQIATKFITNCDRLAYYKLRQYPFTGCDNWFLTNCDKFIIQITTMTTNYDKFIKNFDSYYKLRQNMHP